MNNVAKVGVVAGGYIAALAAALALVALNVATTNRADAQASGGMFAFGDALMFLAVFGVGAVLPTGAGLFFLRPFLAFWRVLSVAAGCLAATTLLAAGVYLAQRHVGPGSGIHAWSALAVLRLLATPLCAAAFLISGALAPARTPRLVLLGSMLVEAIGFLVFVVSFGVDVLST